MTIRTHLSLDAQRLSKADYVLEELRISGEVDRHERSPAWDQDGKDLFLARFLAFFDDGEQTVSVHFQFHPESLCLCDIHALYVRSGEEAQTNDWIAFLQQEQAAFEREKIAQAIEPTISCIPSEKSPPEPFSPSSRHVADEASESLSPRSGRHRRL